MTEKNTTTTTTTTPTAAAADGPEEVSLDLDTVEREGAKPPFTFTHAGRRWMLSDPQDLDWKKLLVAMGDPEFFLRQILPADDREEFFRVDMPTWKLNLLMTRYQEHYGLPNPGNAGGSPA